MNYSGEYTPMNQWHKSRSLQQRASNFGITMIVMGACFILYYLGFFGSQEGPLQPEKIGDALAGMGITRGDMMMFFFSAAIIAGTWNWVVNLTCFLIGARMTCSKPLAGGKSVCGVSVKRKSAFCNKIGEKRIHYVCSQGHKQPEARFQAIKKGPFSHSLWITCLLFGTMIFFIAY
ncbi:MAG: hypothetical protein K9L30_03685 [Desulfobacterales bacterium]|nr:hypothetical protein [Desulfobacterales bacterium]